jgi:uncharacterized protein YjbI with pentapeptide repeats
MRVKFANAAAAIALTVAIGGPAVAGAQGLINGNAVQDESLTGADIQNHTLSGADIRAGSLGSRLFSPRAQANLRGASGATGPQGERGATGPQGPAGAGVTADTVAGDDAPDYQDFTPLATFDLTRAGDYVLFADVTAHNTGLSDDNLNCGLFIDDQAFGGGGVGVASGATGNFTTVGATNVRAGSPETVVLKCQGGGGTTYDLSNIQVRIHDLG